MAGFSLGETHKDGNIKLRFQRSNTEQRHAEVLHTHVCVSVCLQHAACWVVKEVASGISG